MTDNPQETAVDRAERMLIERIIQKVYPPNSELPGERPLSKDLDVARPVLREAFQRLSYKGWLDIQPGRATRVRDYLHEGNINVMVDILDIDPRRGLTFVPDLMHVWIMMAKDYTAIAIHRRSTHALELLQLYESLADTPEACTRAMWQLHRALIDDSENAVYALTFNSFTDLFQRLAVRYYADDQRRASARAFWGELQRAVIANNASGAAVLMQEYLRSVMGFWLAENRRFLNEEEDDDTQ